MSLGLRLLLIAGSLFMVAFVLRRIRKSQMQMEDSVFWIFLALLLVVMSLFPGIVETIAGWIGVQSPANLVFLVIVFLLLYKLFSLVGKVATMQRKLTQLAQRYALDAYEMEDEKHEENH